VKTLDRRPASGRKVMGGNRPGTLRHTERGLALTKVVLEIFRTNGRMISFGDNLTKDIGLTSARWQVMGAIALTTNDVTVSTIARLMGLQRQSVQRVVDLLAEGGLIRLEANPHHKTARVVRLTQRGEEVYRQATQRQVKWVNALAVSMKEHDLEKVLEFLRTLRTRLGDEGPSIRL
jgi:DNA-binding MarR family transcriptional regulator